MSSPTSTPTRTLNGRVIAGLTIDFWATVAKDVHYRKRRELRRDLVHAWLAEQGVDLHQDAVYELLQQYGQIWREAWLSRQFTPGARDTVDWLCGEVGINPSESERQRMADAIDDTVRQIPPVPVEGALEAIRTLSAEFPLALVCDTGLSGGRNIEWLLEQFGIRDAFTFLVFSDAVGRSKPHRAMFETAERELDVPRHRLVHIGDRDDTDVKGSKSIGMAAIRFDGAKDRAECGPCSMADVVVDSWEEIVALLLREDTA